MTQFQVWKPDGIGMWACYGVFDTLEEAVKYATPRRSLPAGDVQIVAVNVVASTTSENVIWKYE